ncbi:hypothetical protein V6N11_081256 [Hibiscus sabdariffa]|uniref:Uncharacterized protein n=1 Tax=Hibiscus sabdariffa TaxID=183260 RepID=A0ABR2QJF7_9ROSI
MGGVELLVGVKLGFGLMVKGLEDEGFGDFGSDGGLAWQAWKWKWWRSMVKKVNGEVDLWRNEGVGTGKGMPDGGVFVW